MPTVTIGANTYEVYADLVTARAYLAGDINGDSLASQTDDVVSKALVTATRILDRQQWLGTATGVVDQVLAWPRTGLTDKDGAPIDDQNVPQFIIDASIELALAIHLDDEVATSEDQGSNLKRAKAEGVEVEFFRPTASSRVTGEAKRFPPAVQELVECFLANPGGVSTATGASFGTSETSSFCDDVYGKSEPYA